MAVRPGSDLDDVPESARQLETGAGAGEDADRATGLTASVRSADLRGLDVGARPSPPRVGHPLLARPGDSGRMRTGGIRCQDAARVSGRTGWVITL